jgi:Zn-dependent metalloprotease
LRTITQSTCTVIPPHILQHVAEHGTTEQRERAASTLSHTLLSHTLQHSAGRPAALIAQPAPLPAGKKRYVYDAGHHQILPGKLVMTEERPAAGDAEAKEAFDGSGVAYDFLARVFLRHSIDDRGMRLDSTVHYGTRFDNALWNGKQMVYGDGDGTLFTRFTADVAVIGHEITHGMTEHTAALEYRGQPGALNEHISDAFGMMIKQWRLGLMARRSDWLIGRGLFGPAVRGVALRSMKAPGTAYDDPVLGKDPQPSHMRHYVSTADDDGGVHINSGIPNYAFYRAATDLGGYAWVVPGRIWYLTLKTRLSPQACFQDFANGTVAVAGELYGIGGNVQIKVANAWSEVGLHVPVSLTRSVLIGRKTSRPGGSSANA